MMPGNGSQFTIPPGFRFHPTDEELLYYYLRKKVAFEPIDLDVIRDVDLNKLEPWDLKERCNIGSGPQNDWYFFSHKDKKYPTGTRTNRATTAGFWKATGRDKAIHLSNAKRIGMRKTLVFYVGRAPHGQKTDWIMHEYRLEEDSMEVQEDGWVVCRVFKKKSLNRGITPESMLEEHQFNHFQQANGSSAPFDLKQNYHLPCDFSSYGNYMHLPQLLSTELPIPSFMQSSMSMNTLDLECTNNLMKLTSEAGCQFQPERPHGDWSILDKLLATNQNQLDQLIRRSPPSQIMEMGSSVQRFPFQYLGCEADLLKFSK